MQLDLRHEYLTVTHICSTAIEQSDLRVKPVDRVYHTRFLSSATNEGFASQTVNRLNLT